MYKIVAVTAAALLVSGCQQNASIRGDTFGRYMQLNAASVVLKRDIRISAGKARVYIQNDRAGVGEQISSGGFDSYRPHCAFEISRVDHAGFDIKAQTFAVTRIQQTVVPVVSRAPVMVARFGFWADSQAYYSGYHFWLASDTQPEVRRMTCYGVYAEPYDLYPPTLQEINAALGAAIALLNHLRRPSGFMAIESNAERSADTPSLLRRSKVKPSQ